VILSDPPDDRATHNNGRITFAELREMLGFTDGEFMSVCHQPVDGSFSSSVIKANNACAQVQSLPERSCTWFSINPVEGPERHGRGRGREREATRWTALYLDCDIKPGVFESQERAWAFINAMSDLIGTHPTAVIHSGHGLQPLWAITDGKLTDEVLWSRAYRLTRRFDRLARKVALECFGAKLDKVADLSRVLRVPNTTNWKNSREPVGTYAVLGTGGPLADMDTIAEFLDQWSAVEVESDHPVGGEVLSNPEGWQFGKRNCPYVINMVTAWGRESDRPKAGRHQWAMNRAVRLACAHRLGCITEDGLTASLEHLESSLAHWCQEVGDPRCLHPSEIEEAYCWSVAKVSTFDDEQTRNQLGNHKHQETSTEPSSDGNLFDGPPIPLTQLVKIPAFPVDSLPEPISKMVWAISEATQTDPAMPGTSALSVLSACTGGRAEIEIRPGWREPLNLYTAIIAESGERKSAVQLAMTRPLFDVERRLAQETTDARRDAETRRQVASQAAERQNRTAARAVGTDDSDTEMTEAIRLAEVVDSIEVPPSPRLIADDITPEAAASLLAEQGGRLAIISAEGGIFDIIAGRYNRNIPNLDLWLKGHSGDRLKVDRKGRDPEDIPRPALTLGLMIQPDVLSTIAAHHQFRGRGFLARILYAYPVSRVGHRRIGAAPANPVVVMRYGAVVGNLGSGMAGWVGDPAILMLTPAAKHALREIEEKVEPMLAGEGELASLRDWGAKYVGAVARIAGILHLAEHGPEEGPRKSVEEETITAAAKIGEYFKACAINAFAQMGTDRVTADTLYLLDRITRMDTDEVSERDLFTSCSRAKFKTMADLMPVLDRLIDHGYLARMPTCKPTGGRPSSPRYKVHPAAKAAQHAEG
jgi:hypothetical protein